MYVCAGMFEKAGFIGRFCHVFIYVPIALFAFTTYGFMTGRQWCQCVAVCCSMLQYVAVCCSVLQCVAVCLYTCPWPCWPSQPTALRQRNSVGSVCWSVSQCAAVCCSALQCVAVCCSVFIEVPIDLVALTTYGFMTGRQWWQCVAVCCSVWLYAAVRCSALQCPAVCCSVLQCAAVCCSVFVCVCTTLFVLWTYGFMPTGRHYIHICIYVYIDISIYIYIYVWIHVYI